MAHVPKSQRNNYEEESTPPGRPHKGQYRMEVIGRRRNVPETKRPLKGQKLVGEEFVEPEVEEDMTEEEKFLQDDATSSEILIRRKSVNRGMEVIGGRRNVGSKTLAKGEYLQPTQDDSSAQTSNSKPDYSQGVYSTQPGNYPYYPRMISSPRQGTVGFYGMPVYQSSIPSGFQMIGPSFGTPMSPNIGYTMMPTMIAPMMAPVMGYGTYGYRGAQVPQYSPVPLSSYANKENVPNASPQEPLHTIPPPRQMSPYISDFSHGFVEGRFGPRPENVAPNYTKARVLSMGRNLGYMEPKKR